MGPVELCRIRGPGGRRHGRRLGGASGPDRHPGRDYRAERVRPVAVGVPQRPGPLRHANGSHAPAPLDRRLHRLHGGSVLRGVHYHPVPLPGPVGAFGVAVPSSKGPALPGLRPGGRGGPPTPAWRPLLRRLLREGRRRSPGPPAPDRTGHQRAVDGVRRRRGRPSGPAGRRAGRLLRRRPRRVDGSGGGGIPAGVGCRGTHGGRPRRMAADCGRRPAGTATLAGRRHPRRTSRGGHRLVPG